MRAGICLPIMSRTINPNWFMWYCGTNVRTFQQNYTNIALDGERLDTKSPPLDENEYSQLPSLWRSDYVNSCRPSTARSETWHPLQSQGDGKADGDGSSFSASRQTLHYIGEFSRTFSLPNMSVIILSCSPSERQLYFRDRSLVLVSKE